jgi:hypothetical protein
VGFGGGPVGERGKGRRMPKELIFNNTIFITFIFESMSNILLLIKIIFK